MNANPPHTQKPQSTQIESAFGWALLNFKGLNVTYITRGRQCRERKKWVGRIPLSKARNRLAVVSRSATKHSTQCCKYHSVALSAPYKSSQQGKSDVVSSTVYSSSIKREEGCHHAHTFYAVKKMQDIFIADWIPSFPLGVFPQAAFQIQGYHTSKINK